ncbi:MAG: hypothetical protein IIW14_03150 [Kiritimatiellae bacterium]|nr:hypothetical protein [Kiritimatiellia bacterium]
MNEQCMIEMFSRIHKTSPYNADAEILPLKDTNLLVSTDSFSEREDFLFGLKPEAMGRVMAYGAITDILACGAKPEYLVQSWNIDRSHDERFYERVAIGIQEVVSNYGAKVIGGDMGVVGDWCWTATVFGESVSPVRRVASKRIDFDLYLTGSCGAANVAAFLTRSVPEPALRDPVPGNALFATDTSGGFFDALENFRRVNAGILIEVDVERALAPGIAHSLPAGVEPGWALVGGVGEYELLFAVPHGERVEGAILVGRGGFGDFEHDGSVLVVCGSRTGHMVSPPPDYRAIPRENWLAETASYWTSLWT